ncbi:hypothetical protein [Rhodovulum viride]|uniref:hypothetical protein n=1 Tax=Rhodovulum viride TaxID=1231134 RepID=UPI0011BF721F|nr:hypothetical protein [Rhodovulum viride]
MPRIGGGRWAGPGGGRRLIVGTGPVLGALADGDTLGLAVTWGTYLSTIGGTLATAREMRLGAGDWASYDGDVEVSAGEDWQIRETVSLSGLTLSRTFLSGVSAVVALEPAWSAPIAGNGLPDLTLYIGGDPVVIDVSSDFDLGNPTASLAPVGTLPAWASWSSPNVTLDPGEVSDATSATLVFRATNVIDTADTGFQVAIISPYAAPTYTVSLGAIVEGQTVGAPGSGANVQPTLSGGAGVPAAALTWSATVDGSPASLPITAVAGTDIVLTASDASHPTGAFSASSSPVTVSAAATLSIDTAPTLSSVAPVEGNTIAATPGTVSGGESTRTWRWYSGATLLQEGPSAAYTITATSVGGTIFAQQVEIPLGSGSPVTRDSAPSGTVVPLVFSILDNDNGTAAITFTEGAESRVFYEIPDGPCQGTYDLDLGVLQTLPVCIATPALTGTATVGELLTSVAFYWVYNPDLGDLVVEDGWETGGEVIADASGLTHLVGEAEAGLATGRTETGTQAGASGPVIVRGPTRQIASGSVQPVISDLAIVRTGYSELRISADVTNVGDGALHVVAGDLLSPNARQISQGLTGEGEPAFRVGSTPITAPGVVAVAVSAFSEGPEIIEVAVAQISISDDPSNVLSGVTSFPPPTATGGSVIIAGPIFDPADWIIGAIGGGHIRFTGA